MTSQNARLLDLDPRRAAEVLVESADADWLTELQLSLDRHRSRSDLDRVLGVWGLSQSEAARLFGVTRQAIGKWRSHGVPQSQIEAVADLAAATDLLLRYLKRDRIPAVVRRASDRLGGRALVQLVASGRTRELLEACRDMFAFADVHS